MRMRGRRTPQKFMRGKGDYDNYRNPPANYREREKEERESLIYGTIYIVGILILFYWLGGKV